MGPEGESLLPVIARGIAAVIVERFAPAGGCRRWRTFSYTMQGDMTRAMADTLSPCRFKSCVTTISPDVTTPPPSSMRRPKVACPGRRGDLALRIGEYSNGTFGESTIGSGTRFIPDAGWSSAFPPG